MTARDDGSDAEVRRRHGDDVPDAFGRRSTFAERFSSIDHLQDLHELLEDGDKRKRFLLECVTRLADWGQFAPREASTQTAATTTTTEPKSGRVGPATVRLTAVHAACGDCLLLDYTPTTPESLTGSWSTEGSAPPSRKGSDAKSVHRMSPPPWMVAVVTHVDRDHIEGVIRALQERRLTAGDYWFNGRDQITSPDEPTVTRSVRQGDALSQLIPDDRRNLVVGGRALVVGDDGPPKLRLLGGASAVLLSPTREGLTRLLAKWPDPTRDGADDLNALLSAFDEEPERGPGQFGQDSSVPNGSAIAFLFEHAGVAVLFTGDAWNSRPHRLDQGATGETEQDPADNDRRRNSRYNSSNCRITQPTEHHSQTARSDRAGKHMICTDGSKYSHPDSDALDLLRQHYPDVPILFTDATDLIRERARQIGASEPSSFLQMIELPTRPPVVADLKPDLEVRAVAIRSRRWSVPA
jgi:hypothetical protein